MKVDILMATFMASIESVGRISGLLCRGSVQGWKAIVIEYMCYRWQEQGSLVVLIALKCHRLQWLSDLSFLKRNGLLGNFLSWFRQREIKTRYLFAQFYRLKDSKRAGFCHGRIVAKILKWNLSPFSVATSRTVWNSTEMFTMWLSNVIQVVSSTQ